MGQEQLDLGDNVTLVIHDWGSVFGFDWAYRHEDRVAGIAYMEGAIAPVGWSNFDPATAEALRGFRSLAGEETVITNNMLIEGMLPSMILRDLKPEEHDESLTLCRTRASTSGAYLYATDSDRGRASRCPRNHRCLQQVAHPQQPPKVVRQRGARCPRHRQNEGLRSFASEPVRGDRARNPLHPGRQPHARSAKRLLRGSQIGSSPSTDRSAVYL